MAVTTHASLATIAVTDLISELEVKLDEVSRCQEVLERVTNMNPGDKIGIEITDFVSIYAPNIQLYVADEGFLETAGDLIKRAIKAIMDAIAWIIEKIKIIFKYLFDSQYRARREILDIQQRLLVLNTIPALVTKFEDLNCSVVKKADVDNIIFKTQTLIGALQSVVAIADSKHANVDHMSAIVRDFCKNTGTNFTSEGKIEDALANATPIPNTTFGTVGWTVQGTLDSIRNYICALNGIDELKEAQKRLENDVSELKDKAVKLSTDDFKQDEVIALQKATGAKVQATKLLAYAIAIAIRRSNNILAFLNSIYKEAHNLNK